jgi:hypothetical protein
MLIVVENCFFRLFQRIIHSIKNKLWTLFRKKKLRKMALKVSDIFLRRGRVLTLSIFWEFLGLGCSSESCFLKYIFFKDESGNSGGLINRQGTSSNYNWNIVHNYWNSHQSSPTNRIFKKWKIVSEIKTWNKCSWNYSLISTFLVSEALCRIVFLLIINYLHNLYFCFICAT